MTTNYFKRTLFLAFMSFLCVLLFAQNHAEDAKKANNIIKYANSVVALNDVYTASLSNYQRVISIADQNISNIRQQNYQLNLIGCNSMQLDQNKVLQLQADKDRIHPFAQKNELDRLVEQADNATQNLFYFCQQLDAYFAEGKYNQDVTFCQYGQLKNGFMNAVRHASVSWNNASQSSVSVANAAEIVLLKYNKQADFVVPMKMDITTFKNILIQFSSGNELNQDLVNQQINQLENSLNLNKNLARENLSKLSNSSHRLYEEFYQNCINGISGLRVLAQQVGQQKNQIEVQQAYSQIKPAYNAAVDAYNAFVKQ